MMCPYGKTKDGFETQFGTNHLGHFLLTNMLLDVIKRSAPSRIINVSSLAHTSGSIHWDDIMWEKGYDSIGAYSQSKLANILFTIELAKRLKGTGVTAVSLHPGVVKTELTRNLHGCMGCMSKLILPCITCCWKTPLQGAQTTIHCAVRQTYQVKQVHISGNLPSKEANKTL
jgi:retinol dehydrogenase 12